MDLKSTFQSAWRAKFTNQAPPSLSCFSKGAKHKPHMENLRQAYEQCKNSIHSLKKQLIQEQFIENFLKNAITELIENNEKNKPEKNASELNSEMDGDGNDHEMTEHSEKNGLGFIEIVEDDKKNSYVRVTSFKNSSSRWKKMKDSVKKKTKFKQNYETVNYPPTREKVTYIDGSMEQCNPSASNSEDELDDNSQNIVRLRKDTQLCDDACFDKFEDEPEPREHRVLKKTCSDPISRISSIPEDYGASDGNDSKRMMHGSPTTFRLTEPLQFEEKTRSQITVPKPPPRKSKSQSSTPFSPYSDESEDMTETIYDNVTRIYVKPHTSTRDSDQSRCGAFQIDADVNSVFDDVLKFNDGRQFGSSCTDNAQIVNNALCESVSLPVHSPASKTSPQSRADGEVGESSVNMRKFRLKSVEQDCIVGTSFRKIDRLNSTDNENKTHRLASENSTESSDQTVKNRMTLPAVLSNSTIKHERRPRSIPHYENWDFHSALTTPGISIIDQEFIDTGSEDDNVSVASAKSRDSALSDDLQIYDAKRIISSEDVHNWKTDVKGLKITEEDVYYNSDISQDVSPQFTSTCKYNSKFQINVVSPRSQVLKDESVIL